MTTLKKLPINNPKIPIVVIVNTGALSRAVMKLIKYSAVNM